MESEEIDCMIAGDYCIVCSWCRIVSKKELLPSPHWAYRRHWVLQVMEEEQYHHNVRSMTFERSACYYTSMFDLLVIDSFEEMASEPAEDFQWDMLAYSHTSERVAVETKERYLHNRPDCMKYEEH
jgi:hypothetical protein